MSGFNLHILDLRGWLPFGEQRKPDPRVWTFPTRELAEAERAKWPIDGVHVVASISPVVLKRKATKSTPIFDKKSSDWLGGGMRSKDRKLTL